MKIFLKVPKYLYSSFDENFDNLVNGLIDEIFYIFNLHFEQKSNEEKLQFSKILYEFKNDLNNTIIKSYLEDSKKQAASEKNKDYPPLYLRILFPILSPFYYILGTPTLKIFLGKIVNYFLDEININNFIYKNYFSELIFSLNKGIDDLDKIRNYFENLYNLDKFEDALFNILKNKNNEINENNINELKELFKKLFNKYSGSLLLMRLEDLFNSLRNSFDAKNNKNIKLKIDNVFMMLKEMTMRDKIE